MFLTVPEVNKQQVCKLNWIAELSSDYNLIFLFQTKQKLVYLQTKQKSTSPNQTQTQPHQTKLIHTKPKSLTVTFVAPGIAERSSVIQKYSAGFFYQLTKELHVYNWSCNLIEMFGKPEK